MKNVQKDFDPYERIPRKKPAKFGPGPVPTLAHLRRNAPWVWIICKRQGCDHAEPMALVPFMIRWGPETSSDKLRARLRCRVCGHRGVKTQLPSAGSELGWYPFPVADG